MFLYLNTLILGRFAVQLARVVLNARADLGSSSSDTRNSKAAGSGGGSSAASSRAAPSHIVSATATSARAATIPASATTAVASCAPTSSVLRVIAVHPIAVAPSTDAAPNPPTEADVLHADPGPFSSPLHAPLSFLPFLPFLSPLHWLVQLTARALVQVRWWCTLVIGRNLTVRLALLYPRLGSSCAEAMAAPAALLPCHPANSHQSQLPRQ